MFEPNGFTAETAEGAEEKQLDFTAETAEHAETDEAKKHPEGLCELCALCG